MDSYLKCILIIRHWYSKGYLKHNRKIFYLKFIQYLVDSVQCSYILLYTDYLRDIFKPNKNSQTTCI